ncbi:sensor histidine kinase [Kitasatospora sp. NPDC057542]|uniref:sensor histidine kinase n=1 Tax=Streptomycetaceae TaxID=2062 RepID=UPI001CCA2D30|nr:histidine kinase [Streptomyces sp. LS1784]
MWGTTWRGSRLLRPALIGSGLGYLLLAGRPQALTATDWAVAVGTLLLAALGGRLPLVVALGQCALTVPAVAHAVQVEVKVGVAAAFFELAVRRWGRPVAGLWAALLCAELAHAWPSVPAALYRTALLGGVPVLLAGYIRAAERVRQAAEERAREAERSRDLAEWGARMGERAAIARELHDMVAHHLASTVLRVGVARHVLPDADPRLTAVLDDVHAGATTALADLRRLLTALREPDAGQLAPLLAETADLPTAVAGVVERSRAAGLRVDAVIGGRLAELDAIGGLTVLRLVQEGLANVVKHAGPGARVRLRATTEDGNVALELENTRGQAGPASMGGGHGLLGMRERVALVGGTIEAGPVPDGWRLAASWPLGTGAAA